MTDRTPPTDDQMKANEQLDRVSVLSLPGFVWFRANYTPRMARAFHSCNLVGNRQLLSIGGADVRDPSDTSRPNPSDFTQGLGIFDMTRMEWSSGYNANAAPYKTPDVIKAWYEKK